MNLLKIGSEWPEPNCVVTAISRLGIYVKMADHKVKFFLKAEVEEYFSAGNNLLNAA
jgi:hypothetical protein